MDLTESFWHQVPDPLLPEVAYSAPVPARPIDYYPLALGSVCQRFVYLLEDRRRRVIYVGFSHRPGQRIDRHRRRRWWSEVDRLILLRVSGADRYAAETVGRSLERYAIQHFQPRHNIAGVVR